MTCPIQSAYEDSPVLLMSRVNGLGDVPIVQADIDSISYRAFEYATVEDARLGVNGEEIGEAATLDVSATVFDALQTALPWDADRDADGYNFRFTLPAARRPTGNRWHRIEVTFAPSAPGEEPFPAVFLVRTKPLAGS